MKKEGGERSKFQIDTGATCNVIRKKKLKCTKYEKRIKPAAHVLKMYNNSSLSPVGKFKNQIGDVTTKKKFKVPFTVVDDHLVKNNHLGCRAVQQMELIRVVTTNHINQVNNDQPMSDHIELTIAETQTAPTRLGGRESVTRQSYLDYMNLFLTVKCTDETESRNFALLTKKIEEEVILPHEISEHSVFLVYTRRQGKDNPSAEVCTTRLSNQVNLWPTLITHVTLLKED